MENVEIVPSDSTYQGRPISQAFPTDSTFALNASWYRSNEPIVVAGRVYVKYGLPRLLGASEVVSVAVFRSVPVFAEPTADRQHPEVIYLPVQSGCEFQPYLNHVGP